MEASEFGIGRLFSAVRDAVIGGDALTGLIVLWNPAAERLFGYAAAEAVGQPMEIIVPERLRAAHRAGLRRYAAAGRGALIDSGAPVELPGLQKSGEEITIELTLSPLAAPAGAVPGSRYVLAVVRDITERRRAEAEREREQRSRLAAEAAVAARDEFISIAAHELKTPITSVLGVAQLALRRYTQTGMFEPERVEKALRTIEERTTALARLVERLLDASRLEAGRLELERRPTDVAALVRRVVEAARPTAGGGGFVLAGPTSLLAEVDEVRIEQVVANLLENAVRYSPNGGRIEVGVEAPDEETLRLSVRDHGIGIAVEQRERVFDRYHQAHRLPHAPGIGLGLFISREIVAAHGGRIELEAPEGGGSRFVVTLPRRG